MKTVMRGLTGIFFCLAICSCAGRAAGGERLLAAGLTAGDARVVPAQTQLPYSRSPAIAFAGGRYLLVYQDGYNGLGGDSNILGIFLDAKGEPSGTPVTICAASGVQDSPAVAACGDRFLVVWSDLRNGRDSDIRAVVVDGTGSAGKEIAVAGGAGQPGGQTAPAVASNGTDTFFVVWQDIRDGRQFEIYGARISADGRLIDQAGLRLAGEASNPAVTFLDGLYYVSTGARGCTVDGEGRVVKAGIIWNGGNETGPWTLVPAYGKTLEIVNLSPSPDPWGWRGNGSIFGLTIKADATCPEDKLAVHRWGAAAASRADREARGVIEAARWKNCQGWPQGRPGGFKGSHDGLWPSGQPAAVFNGRSLLVAWPSGHFIDTLRLGNRDIHMKRVVDGWFCIDEPALSVVTGPTDEINPVLASDAAGGAVLAWERQNTQGGVVVEYAFVRETADTTAPKVVYIQKMSGSRLIIGFDEPLNAASVKPDSVVIDGTEVKSVEFNTEGPALGREIIVETGVLTTGKTYAAKITGVTDTFGNAVKGEPLVYVARPGLAQRTQFISRWLTIGRWPADYDSDHLGAGTCYPSPGDRVKAPEEKDLISQLTKFVSKEKYLELTKESMESAVMRDFGDEKVWNISNPRWANSVLDFVNSGIKKANFSLVYAHTYVWSDDEREVMLRIDSNAGHRAWLNGKVVSDDPAGPKLMGRGIHDRTNEINVKLGKGWNRLLIGVDTSVYGWSLVAQFTDQNRIPVRDLTYQLEKP